MPELTEPELGPFHDYEWLVRERSKTQDLLRNIYEFGYGPNANVSGDDHRMAIYGLLVGAAFSLWRAVFLASELRPKTSVWRHQKHFLEHLIADNAIAYPQDKKTLQWTFGYYLNSAYLRLDRALMQLGFDPSSQDWSDLSAYNAIRDRQLSEAVINDPRGAWNVAFNATQRIYRRLGGGRD